MSQKKGSYFQKKQQADRTFGRSTVRPQDVDKELAIQCRNTNLRIPQSIPLNYSEDVETNILQFVIPEVSKLPKKLESHSWVTGGVPTDEVSYNMSEHSVFSVDFEMHNEESFDGYICVASFSTGHHTYVVDCINKQRIISKRMISTLMSSTRCLKVMCGLTRLRRDWQIFSHVVVDVQDMFEIFKKNKPDLCLEIFRLVTVKRLKAAGKSTNSSDIESYIKDRRTPGLQFLADALVTVGNPKDDICTLADWRKRPLHSSLVRYAALDAFLTMKVYENLFLQIGLNGVREAMLAGMQKLLKLGSLSKYPNPVAPQQDQWTSFSRILKWREYLAKNLDKKPQQIIKDCHILALLKEVHLKHLEVDVFEKLLVSYNVGDEPRKSAFLLRAYVEEDTKVLDSMQTIICHRCNLVGHTARFCYSILDEEQQRQRKREFYQRPETSNLRVSKNARKWLKYCEKKQRDLETKPWKQESTK